MDDLARRIPAQTLENTTSHQGMSDWPQIRLNWHQMGQIWTYKDFNEQKTDLRPDLPYVVPSWLNLRPYMTPLRLRQENTSRRKVTFEPKVGLFKTF